MHPPSWGPPPRLWRTGAPSLYERLLMLGGAWDNPSPRLAPPPKHMWPPLILMDMAPPLGTTVYMGVALALGALHTPPGCMGSPLPGGGGGGAGMITPPYVPQTTLGAGGVLSYPGGGWGCTGPPFSSPSLHWGPPMSWEGHGPPLGPLGVQGGGVFLLGRGEGGLHCIPPKLYVVPFVLGGGSSPLHPPCLHGRPSGFGEQGSPCLHRDPLILGGYKSLCDTPLQAVCPPPPLTPPKLPGCLIILGGDSPPPP